MSADLSIELRVPLNGPTVISNRHRLHSAVLITRDDPSTGRRYAHLVDVTLPDRELGTEPLKQWVIFTLNLNRADLSTSRRAADLAPERVRDELMPIADPEDWDLTLEHLS